MVIEKTDYQSPDDLFGFKESPPTIVSPDLLGYFDISHLNSTLGVYGAFGATLRSTLHALRSTLYALRLIISG